jgi:hypothetical protein
VFCVVNNSEIGTRTEREGKGRGGITGERGMGNCAGDGIASQRIGRICDGRPDSRRGDGIYSRRAGLRESRSENGGE